MLRICTKRITTTAATIREKRLFCRTQISIMPFDSVCHMLQSMQSSLLFMPFFPVTSSDSFGAEVKRHFDFIYNLDLCAFHRTARFHTHTQTHIQCGADLSFSWPIPVNAAIFKSNTRQRHRRVSLGRVVFFLLPAKAPSPLFVMVYLYAPDKKPSKIIVNSIASSSAIHSVPDSPWLCCSCLGRP